MNEERTKYLADTLRDCLADYMITPDEDSEMAVRIAIHLYKEATTEQSMNQPAA